MTSQESRSAYQAAKAFKLTQQDRVFTYIAAQGKEGATREEIATALGMKVASVCPAVHALVTLGRIVKNGLRPTTSGVNAGVLVLNPYKV